MKLRPVCLLLLLPWFAFVGTARADRPWTEVRSPHFRVLTNGSVADARHVAQDFEELRYVFVTQFPRFRVDSGAPLTIFAARDEGTAKMLEPGIWKLKGVKPAGTFQHGWEKQFVMLRLDEAGLSSPALVYHEYTHSILHMNSHWLPVWLDEGMAEFYGHTKLEKHKIYIGGITDRVRTLQETPIPIETLLTDAQPMFNGADPNRVDMFYAESWALVHYMVFGPGMDGGAKLNRFFALLQHGDEQMKAFRQVFGDPAAMDKEFYIYMRSFGFRAALLPNPPQISEKDFTERKLTMPETEAELAGFHVWNRDYKDARPLVAQALKDDPKLGLAHEEQGFLLFGGGQATAAKDEFSQAYALDGKLYLSLFAKTMLSPMASSSAPADEAEFQGALEKVVALNPQFAPAYVQMARLALRRNDPKTALGLARRAEDLEPSRAGYHLLTGEVYLRMGEDANAAEFARYVAQRWFGPDHDEAVALWESIPAGERGTGDALEYQIPKDTKTAEGTLKSASCVLGVGDVFVLDRDGHDLTFRSPKGYFAIGMPDTLWYGHDHFSVCHNVDGMQAVVRYGPAADPSYAGDVAEIELRDPLPAPDEKAPLAGAAGGAHTSSVAGAASHQE